jgi:hypothetical protein
VRPSGLGGAGCALSPTQASLLNEAADEIERLTIDLDFMSTVVRNLRIAFAAAGIVPRDGLLAGGRDRALGAAALVASSRSGNR